MAPLKPLAYREIKRRLMRAGFAEVSQRGSHVKFSKNIQGRTVIVIVPNHDEVAVGTLKSILRQAQLSTDEFLAL